MAQDLVISIGSIVFVIVGLITMNKGRKEWVQSERIAETETTQVRDIKPGVVEVKGSAQLTEDATVRKSPLTNTDAIAVHVEVKEWDTDGHGAGNWKTIFEESTAEPMFVEDGTGEVLVELPTEGELNLEETEIKVDSDDEPPEAVRQYVAEKTEIDIPERRDIGPLSIGERRKYLEGVLEPDEDAYVLGTARKTDAGWDQRGYVIDEPTESGDFILSDKSESDLLNEGKRGGLIFLVFGGLMAVVGAGTLLISLTPA